MIPAELLVHTVTVEAYEGSGAYGDILAAPVTVPCYYEQTTRLVRNSTGEETVSQTQVYTDPPGTPTKLADGTPVTIPAVPGGSIIALPDGTRTTVLNNNVLDDGGLTGLAHQEIDCE